MSGFSLEFYNCSNFNKSSGCNIIQINTKPKSNQTIIAHQKGQS